MRSLSCLEEVTMTTGSSTTSPPMLLLLKARRVSAASSPLSSTNRIARWFMPPPFWLRPQLATQLQREVKCRALLHGPFGPDSAAVAVNDALHAGQTNAVAGELVHPVQALERADQLVGGRH